METCNTNPSQIQNPSSRSVERLIRATEYVEALKRSNVKFGDVHNAEQDLGFHAGIARNRVLTFAMCFMHEWPTITREEYDAQRIEPMEAARMIAADLTQRAGTQARDARLDAELLTLPAQTFTCTQAAQYIRLRFVGTGFSQREIDSALLRLRGQGKLTMRGGYWVKANFGK